MDWKMSEWLKQDDSFVATSWLPQRWWRFFLLTQLPDNQKKVIFLCVSSHLAEVFTVADGQAVHALLIRDKEASVLKQFAELQMLSALLLIIYIRPHKSDQ